MDRIEKFLAKVTKAESVAVQIIISKLIAGDTRGLDIRKLKDKRDEYRVRKGRLRIQFIRCFREGNFNHLQRFLMTIYKFWGA